jgi:hypothetical protein
MLAGYRPDQLTSLYRRIHHSLSAIPGVSAVAPGRELAFPSRRYGERWLRSIRVYRSFRFTRSKSK